MIGDVPHGQVTLKVQTHVRCAFVIVRLAIAVLDHVAGLDVGQNKCLSSQLRALGFGEFPIENRVLLQFDNRTVRLDRAPGYV